MDDKKKTGIIASIVFLVIFCFCFIYSSIEYRFFFLTMLSDFFKQLFLMLLYAVIPCVPAVLLRAKFGVRALKWISLAATILAILCCAIHIAMPETVLYGKVALSSYSSGFKPFYANEWVFIFTQFALTSSVPVLYCVAFTGDLYWVPFVRKERSMLVILAPSLMFFLSLFIRYIVVYGFLAASAFIFSGDMVKLLISSVLYAFWAFLLAFISRMIYREIKKRGLFDNPKIIKYAQIILGGVFILALTLAGLKLFINNDDKLVKNYNEKFGRYEFFYKKSVLVIRKEIFDGYELNDGHIQKFFNGAEMVYIKLAGFFPEHDFPKEVVYHAVPEKWDLESDYEYYGDKIHLGLKSWADPWTNETFYEENMLAVYLSRIDAGFPANVCHELGRLFTTSAYEKYQYYNRPYVWNPDFFAVLAEYYIASEIPVINAGGETLTAGYPEDSFYSEFFGWAEKYGYKTISDILKKVDNASPDIDSAERHPLVLFVKFLSQETGDNIELAESE